jgi:hypothetical protein
MAKVTITFEGNSWHDALNEIMRTFSSQPQLLGDLLDERAPTPEPPPSPPVATASEPKKATRAKPSATKAPPPPEPEPEPELEPEALPPAPMPPASHMPALDVLKQVVTVAVRSAQKNGGPKKILELLPDFKSETGLDFVMNAKEEHRPALFNLVQAAGLDA